MNIRICDLCNEPFPKHWVQRTNVPDGEDDHLELCETCISDIHEYIKTKPALDK